MCGISTLSCKAIYNAGPGENADKLREFAEAHLRACSDMMGRLGNNVDFHNKAGLFAASLSERITC